MNRCLRWGIVAAGLCLLAACASVLLPSSITLTAEQMQTRLAQSFPLEKQYMNVVDLTLSQPQVQLHPDQKRIALQFDVNVTALGYDQLMNGRMLVSSQLAYNAADRTIVLQHPQLESQQIRGVSDNVAQIVSQITAVAIHDRLEGAVVYAFTPEQLHFLGGHAVPESIEITERGVVLHLAKN